MNVTTVFLSFTDNFDCVVTITVHDMNFTCECYANADLTKKFLNDKCMKKDYIVTNAVHEFTRSFRERIYILTYILFM